MQARIQTLLDALEQPQEPLTLQALFDTVEPRDGRAYAALREGYASPQGAFEAAKGALATLQTAAPSFPAPRRMGLQRLALHSPHLQGLQLFAWGLPFPAALFSDKPHEAVQQPLDPLLPLPVRVGQSPEKPRAGGIASA